MDGLNCTVCRGKWKGPCAPTDEWIGKLRYLIGMCEYLLFWDLCRKIEMFCGQKPGEGKMFIWVTKGTKFQRRPYTGDRAMSSGNLRETQPAGSSFSFWLIHVDPTQSAASCETHPTISWVLDESCLQEKLRWETLLRSHITVLIPHASIVDYAVLYCNLKLDYILL